MQIQDDYIFSWKGFGSFKLQKNLRVYLYKNETANQTTYTGNIT